MFRLQGAALNDRGPSSLHYERSHEGEDYHRHRHQAKCSRRENACHDQEDHKSNRLREGPIDERPADPFGSMIFKLGFYVVALRFVDELGNLIVGSIGVVAFPTFSRLQADRQKLVQAFLKATEYTAFLAFPAFVGLGVVVGEFIPTVLGPQWTPSVPVTRALIPMGMIGSLSGFIGSMIAAKGKPSWNVTLGLLGLSVGVIAIIAAVPLGLVAVSFAYAISTVAGYSAGLWVVKRMVGFEMTAYLKNIAIALGAALAMGILVVLLGATLLASAPANARLILSVVAGAAFYVGLVRVIRPQLIRELLELGRTIRN